MTSKFSLAALALVAALLSIPSGANAGFVGHDRYWGGDRLWSFGWLCGNRAAAAPVAARPVKVRRYKAVPQK